MRPQLVADTAMHGVANPPRRSLRDRMLLILWPAFVMAGVLEMLVFAVVDPSTMHWFGADPIDWSRSAVYSVTFFIFWGVIATAGAITALLEEPGPTASEKERRP
jgi:hypothetical protein